MNKLKIIALITLCLGIVSFFFLTADFLALADIWKGREANLDNEWTVVGFSILPIAVFHLSVFVCLTMLLSYFGKKNR